MGEPRLGLGWHRGRLERGLAAGGAVTLLLKADGSVASVWASTPVAEAIAAKYNAEPFIDGEPDPDAPYSVKTWSVR